MRQRNRPGTVISQRGMTLLEIVVALALMGLVIPLVLGGLSAITTNTDHVYDRSVMLELAQTQLEYIESQPYSESAAGYTLVITPSGYTIQVQTATAVTYTYAAPKSTPTQETVQLIMVTVSGVYSSLAVSRYRVRG
ncbi:MAG: type II secretion system protein [Dehalococcoidia bacterium]|nr:type II secretion system protein [Dehalococcoidia bacterium]